jgi:general secretion pathway protein B
VPTPASPPAAPNAVTAPPASESATRYNPPLLEEDPALADEPAPSPRGAPINPADYQPATTSGQTAPLGTPNAYGAAAPPSTVQPPSHGPTGSTGPTRSPGSAGSAQTSGVPSRDDLVAAGQGGIPEANVSLHVYDRNPAARFVFVNGQRAKEGDVLANGIRVDEIRADGAVLSFRGARFLVPNQ